MQDLLTPSTTDAKPAPGNRDHWNAIRTGISQIHHDLGNPLSIVSGNAELLLAMASLMQFDDDTVRSLHDIRVASRQMEALLDRLIRLRDLVPKPAESDPSALAEDAG
jgi:signal transduction histidine kinase